MGEYLISVVVPIYRVEAYLEQCVRSRYNIGSRLTSVSGQLERIQSQLLRIQSTVESGANGYYAADMTASLKARQFPTRP